MEATALTFDVTSTAIEDLERRKPSPLLGPPDVSDPPRAHSCSSTSLAKMNSRTSGDPEKQQLVQQPASSPPSTPRPSTSPSRLIAVRLLLAFVLFRLLASSHVYPHLKHGVHYLTGHKGRKNGESICPQVAALAPPPNDALDANKDVVFSAEYRERSAAVHGGLVKIRCVEFDGRWEGRAGADAGWQV